ncbi:MAG: hypothetical protein ACR2IE_12480 [Candidatus Sumerlaeaceae bacterium]
MPKPKPKKPGRAAPADNAKLISEKPGLFYFILLILLLALGAFFVTIRPVSDPDSWFHMALGKWVLEHHEIPRIDPFAGSSPGREWISSGWLPSVLMQLLFRRFGESGVGLLLMSFFVILSTYGTVLIAARKWFGDGGLIFFPLMLGLGLACVRFNPRPDIFSQLMLACTLLVLVLAERPGAKAQWYLYSLLPVFALWANLHAGFLIGLLVLGVYCAWLLQQAVTRKARPFLWRLIPCMLCFAVVLLNPYGFGVYRLAQKIARVPQVGWIMEWMPFFKTGFPMPAGAYICGALLLASVVVVLWRTKADWWRWAVAGLLLVMALLQRRQVGPAAIGMCVILLPSLSAISFRWMPPRAILIAAAALVTALICGFKVSGKLGGGNGGPRTGIDCGALPCVATDFLAANRPPQKMLNAYAFGGYLLYYLGPETKVFIDGRLDVYDPQVFLDILAVEENRLPLEEIEKRYGVKTWVLSIDDAIGDAEHLASRLADRPDFALVHFDDQAAVFIKRSTETNAYIKKNEFSWLSPWRVPEVAQAVQSSSANAVFDEVDRALRQSMGSANANALAALVAASAGDRQTAQQLVNQALARDPENPLTQQVVGLLRQR